ncbi:MAG TPA: PSD1 and planctomycete cytochrome C domain-containing protein [Planctomycetota bacterium]|nr:PSD1 and planctomycete cytochrome C domain-containing protein [Planctomycetota bacterium]
MRLTLSAIAVLLLGTASQAQQQAAPPLSADQIDFFEKKIRPIFVERCYKCHSIQADKVKGGLLLDTREGLLKGGDSGPAIVPGDPEKSILIKAIRQTDELRMPVKEKLPDDQIADFVVWIRMGAPDPRLAPAATKASSAAPSLAEARKFWSFRPPRETMPPIVRSPWCRTPIDHFILAKLEEKRMKPAPEADPRTLLRRVTIDLTGLPPSAEESAAFLADSSPDAYEKVVDRLLASPRYGERWGRHWLDIARYADTKEWVVDEERRLPYPYTYRDWVIKAFNSDLPYDRFLMLQIAADRLQAGDDRTDLAALGFLTVGRSFLNRQPDIIDDRIDVISRGVLGLTVTCARCHDHKYDPIPTKDYYSLYGILASSAAPKEMPLLAAPKMSPEYAAYLKELGAREAEVSKFKETRRVEISATFRSASQIAAYLLAAQESKGKPDDEAKAAGLNAAIFRRWVEWLKTNPPELAAWRVVASRPIEELWTALIGAPAPIAQAFAEAPGSLREAAERYGRAFLEEPFQSLVTSPEFPSNVPIADIDTFLTGDDRGKLKQLRRKIEELHHHPGAPARAMTLEESATPHNPRVFIRGNPGTPGDEVPRQFLAILSPDDRQAYKDGGRLELAREIASAQNPLTARVFVNRVWAQHFGAGLVRTPSNFGVRGDLPTHPELLDWLARAFVTEGWSVKKLHRLILLSSVYRQSTSDQPENRREDPLNLLLWRQNRRRLDLESMRDSILAVAGTLDPAMGGRSVEITTAPFSTRRTVYGYIDRLNLANLYKTFDFAVPDMHSPGRFVTTIPQQALFMMNSPFIMEQAGKVADLSEIQREELPERRIQAIYRRIYGREASPKELALGVSYIAHATPAPSVSRAPIWQYGYGTGASDFHPLPHFGAQGWMGSAKQLPDPTTGWCLLTATGGHAGNDVAHGVIRRWTAPQAGTISISGTIGHHSTAGDGVHGRIVSSRQGELAGWQVVRLEAETKITGLPVEAGETIDFIVDCRADVTSDSFSWAPLIRMGEQEWNAQSGFGGPAPTPPPGMSAWEKYIQVLLESNEFLFVD